MTVPTRRPRRGPADTPIPDSHADLIGAPHLAHLATINADGSPQVSPVWVKRDGDDVLFSTAANRLKARNLQRDGRLALSIHDSANPYRYLELRGTATITPDPDHVLLDDLAKAYMGVEKHPWTRPEDVRIAVRLQVHYTYTMD